MGHNKDRMMRDLEDKGIRSPPLPLGFLVMGEGIRKRNVIPYRKIRSTT